MGYWDYWARGFGINPGVIGSHYVSYYSYFTYVISDNGQVLPAHKISKPLLDQRPHLISNAMKSLIPSRRRLKFYGWVSLIALVFGIIYYINQWIFYDSLYYKTQGVIEANSVELNTLDGSSPVILEGEELNEFLLAWSSMGFSQWYYGALCHDPAFTVTFHYKYSVRNTVESLCIKCANIDLNPGGDPEYLGFNKHSDAGMTVYYTFIEKYPDLFEKEYDSHAFTHAAKTYSSQPGASAYVTQHAERYCSDLREYPEKVLLTEFRADEIDFYSKNTIGYYWMDEILAVYAMCLEHHHSDPFVQKFLSDIHVAISSHLPLAEKIKEAIESSGLPDSHEGKQAILEELRIFHSIRKMFTEIGGKGAG